jgi:hypothetical protein
VNMWILKNKVSYYNLVVLIYNRLASYGVSQKYSILVIE